MGSAAHSAPAENPVHYERRRSEQATLYQLVHEHVEIIFAQVEAQTGARLPDFVKDRFEAFLVSVLLFIKKAVYPTYSLNRAPTFPG